MFRRYVSGLAIRSALQPLYLVPSTSGLWSAPCYGAPLHITRPFI